MPRVPARGASFDLGAVLTPRADALFHLVARDTFSGEKVEGEFILAAFEIRRDSCFASFDSHGPIEVTLPTSAETAQ